MHYSLNLSIDNQIKLRQHHSGDRGEGGGFGICEKLWVNPPPKQSYIYFKNNRYYGPPPPPIVGCYRLAIFFKIIVSLTAPPPSHRIRVLKIGEEFPHVNFLESACPSPPKNHFKKPMVRVCVVEICI